MQKLPLVHAALALAIALLSPHRAAACKPAMAVLDPPLSAAQAALALPVAAAPNAEESLELLGQLTPAGTDLYSDVWGEGHYAYVGTRSGGQVFVIDISDPSAPTLVSTYDSGDEAHFYDVKVYDGVGYFASNNHEGLHIVDLSDPASPTLLAIVTAADGGFDAIHNVFYRDGLLFQADFHTETVKVFDVRDPANPTFVRDIVTPESNKIHDVTVIGDRMFASGWSGATYVYDVSGIETAAPVFLGDVPSGYKSHSTWATSDGNTLISVQERSDGDVKIFDIADVSSPSLLSTVNRTTLGIDAHAPHNPIVFDDRLLFLSWYQAGLVVLDILDPANPVLVGRYDTYSGSEGGFTGNWGIHMVGLDRILLSDTMSGLYVLSAQALAPEIIPAIPGFAAPVLAAALLLAGLWRIRRL